MLIVGITGRSGSGKSLVAGHYRSLGYPVLDGDAVSRQITLPGSAALEELTAYFGPEICNPDQTLNRRALAQLAFSSPEKNRMLVRITHPHILRETMRRAEAAREDGARLFFIDGAMIVGGPVQPLCNSIILVTASHRLSVSRIILRDGISKTAAQQRLAAQPPEDVLRAAASHIIENNSTEAALLAQADRVLACLLGKQ